MHQRQDGGRKTSVGKALLIAEEKKRWSLSSEEGEVGAFSQPEARAVKPFKIRRETE